MNQAGQVARPDSRQDWLCSTSREWLLLKELLHLEWLEVVSHQHHTSRDIERLCSLVNERVGDAGGVDKVRSICWFDRSGGGVEISGTPVLVEETRVLLPFPSFVLARAGDVEPNGLEVFAGALEEDFFFFFFVANGSGLAFFLIAPALLSASSSD